MVSLVSMGGSVNLTAALQKLARLVKSALAKLQQFALIAMMILTLNFAHSTPLDTRISARMTRKALTLSAWLSVSHLVSSAAASSRSCL